MNEPTTSLDARAAAIVMRTVKNVADTGRTILYTIHQPNIDLLETVLSNTTIFAQTRLLTDH